MENTYKQLDTDTLCHFCTNDAITYIETDEGLVPVCQTCFNELDLED